MISYIQIHRFYIRPQDNFYLVLNFQITKFVFLETSKCWLHLKINIKKFWTGPTSQNAKYITFECRESFIFFSRIFCTCPSRDIVWEHSNGRYKNLLYFSLLDTGLVREIPFRHFTLNLCRILSCIFYCLEYLSSLTVLTVIFHWDLEYIEFWQSSNVD